MLAQPPAPVRQRIAPRHGWSPLQLGELWAYRELLVFLAWRDVKVRYKQTFLGVGWAVLVPLMTMVVFNVLFGLLMEQKPTVAGVPYAVSTFCALVPWQLFANTMNLSSNSLINNRGLITKVYFPRLIAPLAPVLAMLVDFLIALAMLAAIMAGYHLMGDYEFQWTWRLLTLPVWTALAVMTAVALAVWFSALNAVYRDIRYIVPIMVQMLMFVSPVLFATSSVIQPQTPAWVATLFALNPLTCVMDGFRWSLLGQAQAPGWWAMVSVAVVMLWLVGGLFYFRRMERTFADLA